jgi:hypothetical protein
MTMSWSITETQANVMKAVRGAYLPWGLAQDAARATSWLERHDLPGLNAIAGLVARNDGRSAQELSPENFANSPWAAPSGALCPLICGAYLSDCAATGNHQINIEFAEIAYPLLLVPFAAIAATKENPVAICWEGFEIICAGDAAVMKSGESPTNPPLVKWVKISPSQWQEENPVATKTRANPSAETADILARFAHRTYVPATEASRLQGAGSGLNDND